MQRPDTSFDHNYGVANIYYLEWLYAMSRMSRKVSFRTLCTLTSALLLGNISDSVPSLWGFGLICVLFISHFHMFPN
ncbi:hypothetical protein IW262DRAFT_1347892 [Armillaria fumosa]|nr:hypothetical protein IW262DRAFT_1347892 [Armillaria fumosa]